MLNYTYLMTHVKALETVLAKVFFLCQTSGSQQLHKSFSALQVKEVESVIPDLVQDFQRFFLLDMTDKKWQEHLQVIFWIGLIPLSGTCISTLSSIPLLHMAASISSPKPTCCTC